ncbi:hypothetical protein ONA91_26045 [Micromonospora sp. DR5-3]|uniref:glycosyltransferase n=1 Tax=unclassified Micromonospora TaxID=2617518 RepID=UPI0011D3D88E|nr:MULTISPECIES: hypothetical protein [unclassified Micromonospora]MCW3817916.1 hypothetical protein [Micromonospora sp. DR5-3]TYC19257.1 hypothetical protein FXF52_37615 [Micromonospora sp. MP36]
MRMLLCPIDTPGFSYPTVAVGKAVADAGHHVLQLCPLRGVRGAGLHVVDPSSGPFAIEQWFEEKPVNQQYALTLAAIDQYQPDVILTSMLAMGPLLAAQASRVPAAVMGLMSYVWPADEHLATSPPAGYGANRALRHRECQALLAQAARWVGNDTLNSSPGRDPLLGEAFLLRTSRHLEPFAERLPSHVHAIGPARWEPQEPRSSAETLRMLQWLDEAPLDVPVLYAQLGRVFRKGDVWAPLLDIASNCDVRIVVDISRSDSHQPPLPDNMRAACLTTSDALIRRATTVLTTGGSSATLSALVHGRPLILVPTGGEQRVTAEVCRRWQVAVEWPERPSQLFTELQDPNHPLRVNARGIAGILNARAGMADPVVILDGLSKSQAAHLTTA